MKFIKIYVVVPSEFKYRLASSFPPERIEAYKKRGIEFDVVRLAGVDVDADDEESIILDARPDSEIHLRIPEHLFRYLDDEELGCLVSCLRYQCSHIDPTETIFWRELRSLFEYCINHVSGHEYKISLFKFYYATVGCYQHVDKKSKVYLEDVIKECRANGYCHEVASSDMLGVSYYLLAREEADREKKHQLILQALAYNECNSLDQHKFPAELGVMGYALTMIEAAEIINYSHHGHTYNGAYEKAIFIMKQLLNSVCQSVLNLEPLELRRCNIEYFKVQVDFVEKCLSEKAPSEFHGQIEEHFKNLFDRQSNG